MGSLILLLERLAVTIDKIARSADKYIKYHDGLQVRHLTCYGCARAARDVGPPGFPSMSDVCKFCVRNPLCGLYANEPHVWPDGSPVEISPMDAYESADMERQNSKWFYDAENKGQHIVKTILRDRGIFL